MKPIKNSLIFLIFTIITIDLIECTDFVPVYMWGNLKVTNHVPALHKTSQATFKDHLQEYSNEKPLLIMVFAEYNLSPEDFALKNSLGEAVFTNLPEFKKTSHVNYNPLVGNPIPTIKKLNKPVTELSITSLLKKPDVPSDSILIIELNDAKDDEDRLKMLKRHDSEIGSIYKYYADKHTNILAFYTAHHASIVTPDDGIHKQSRHLLEDKPKDDTKNYILFDSCANVLMFLSDVGNITTPNKNYTVDGTYTCSTDGEEKEVKDDNEKKEQNIVFHLKKDAVTITFNFSIDASSYWSLMNIQIEDITFDTPTIFAPLRFSYHCSDLVMSTKINKDSKDVATIAFPGFQIQAFDKANKSEKVLFGDAYDCVGFTSVPIWSGIFVTFILLLIMTFGLTMMMDIKTMDRFDDAKGKTITINASE